MRLFFAHYLTNPSLPMKTKTFLFALIILVSVYNCSKNVEYSEAFQKETAGSYLFNQDDVIEVYYENKKLLLKWREGLLTPVALDTNEFFVADMYTKLHFVVHPETNERYLSIISEDNPDVITYDYLKAPIGYKTPSTLLKEGEYDKALAGYLEIKKKDSTSIFIEEWDFNSMGYKHIRKKEYEKAIGVLKINAELHPSSANVFDSLAHAYKLNGDSLLAYNNYLKSLELNNGNKRAREYVDTYKSKIE